MKPRMISCLRWSLPTLVVLLFRWGTGIQAAGLVFQATTVKDTTLKFESVWVKFTVHNAGSERRVYRYLFVSAQFVNTTVRDLVTGRPIRLCMLDDNYFPSRDENSLPGLLPGEEHSDHSDLVWVAACTMDSAVRLPYFPSGKYRAVFAWTYDPYNRALQGGVTTLVDSVDFVVVDPVGEDLPAQVAYLAARRKVFEEGKAEGVKAFWEMSRAYPKSPYSGQALDRLLKLLPGGVPLPSGISEIDVIKAFVLSSPLLPQCERLLAEVQGQLDKDETAAFLRQIRDSVPGTLAARKADALLKGDQLK